MSVFHVRVRLKQGDIVEVGFYLSCKFYLMTDDEYSNYLKTKRLAGITAHFSKSPARLEAPRGGYWNAVMVGGDSISSTSKMLKVIPKEK